MNVFLTMISLLTNIVACAFINTTFEPEKFRPLGKYDLERLKNSYTHLRKNYLNEQKSFRRFSIFLYEHYKYVSRMNIEDPNCVDVKIASIEEAMQRFKENNTKKLQKYEVGSKMYVKISNFREEILECYSKRITLYGLIKAWMERHPDVEKRKADVEKAKEFYEKIKRMEHELEQTRSHINLIEYSLRKTRKSLRKRVEEENQKMESTDL